MDQKVESVKEKKEKLLKGIGRILKDYNFNEADIPRESDYWRLFSEYRSICNF